MRAKNLIICLSAVLAAALAGCASGGAGEGAAASGSTSALHVRISMYGGPMQPNGHMALDGAPAPDEPVTVTDDAGRPWRARTGDDGVATLQLPAGHYRVTSTYCGLPTQVRLAAGRPAATVLRCDVP